MTLTRGIETSASILRFEQGDDLLDLALSRYFGGCSPERRARSQTILMDP